MHRADGALYIGSVMHHRLRPKQHRLRYSIFYLLIDLDRIDQVARPLRMLSRNRFNLFSFRDRDYGDGSTTPLPDQARAMLRDAQIEADGPVRLLTMPRILGYAFNPLSVFFCYRADETLAATIYEVNNTFGQRHCYLIPVERDAAVPIRQESDKSFYVSPFMSTAMRYAFSIVPPADDVAVSVSGSDSDGPLIMARLKAERRPLTDAALMRVFIGFPLLTVKVVLGIHWEALKLWLKGIKLHPRPEPPEARVTLGQPIAQTETTPKRAFDANR